jgi:hypothetical protein
MIVVGIDRSSAVLIPRRACPKYVEGINSPWGWRNERARMSTVPEKYDPGLWTDELPFLNKPGEANIQSDLFYNYRTNVEAYSKWQAWMQTTQPRLLVLWGKYDLSFECVTGHSASMR